jgi:hypothetical protein
LAISKIEAKSPQVGKSAYLLEACHHRERRRPPRAAWGLYISPSCLLLTRCAWCPPDPSLFLAKQRPLSAWFRQTPAQVRALQPTPRKRTIRTPGFPLLQGFPTAHRSLPYSSLPIHLPPLRNSSKRKQASFCFRHLLRLVEARRGGEQYERIYG